MSAVMLRSIALRHPDTMEAVVLLEGSELPKWAVDLVHPDDVTGKASRKPPVASTDVPPMGGAGSGAGEWLAYARSFDPPVEVADDAKRDDIVAAVKAAGHPVEPEQK